MAGTAPSHDVAYRWRRGVRTGWTTIGYAFTDPANGRITVGLNAVPVPGLEADPGKLVLYPKKPSATDEPD